MHLEAIRSQDSGAEAKYAHCIDNYNNRILQCIKRLNVSRIRNMDRSLNFVEAGKSAANIMAIPEIAEFSRLEPGERTPYWTEYLEAAKLNTKFQPDKILNEIRENYQEDDDYFCMKKIGDEGFYSDLILKRQCKLGLQMAVKGTIPVHFVLDGIDIDLVATKKWDYGQSITASELRWIRRNWEVLKQSVTFYFGDRVVAAPWEQDPAFDARYQPKLRNEPGAVNRNSTR